MHVLVTGISGFIGRNFLTQIARQRPDWVVYGVGRDPARLARCAAILPSLRPIVCDLSQADIGLETPIDAVVHLASWVSLPRDDVPGAERLLCNNTLGTVRLWRWIENARRRPTRVIHASSITVYGEPATQPVAEDAPRMPSSFYGLSKLGAELYSEYCAAKFGIPNLNLRIGYVYGPQDDSGKVLYKWAAAACSGAPITIDSSPHVFRDYIFVEDVARALFELTAAQTLPDGALNLSAGRGVTLLEVARTLQRLGGCAAPLHVTSTPGDHFGGCVIQSRRRFDNLFPDFPFTELVDGLRKLLP